MGLEMDDFDACVAEARPDQRLVAGTQLFRELGGRGTPTFFVVGYAPIPGAIPLDLFRQALDTAYARAMNADAPGS
jgi:protein-disulfide isomerase